MSRLAKKPILLPNGVDVIVQGLLVNIKGPKGQLSFEICKGIVVAIEGKEVFVSASDEIEQKSFLGLDRARLCNAVKGVSDGFMKKLQLVGVGFKAALKGQDLDMTLGFSHPNVIKVPEGLTIAIDKGTAIAISGIDKQLVGQFAAKVRALRPPEPYKGKGIRYENEVVRRKAGKSAKK